MSHFSCSSSPYTRCIQDLQWDKGIQCQSIIQVFQLFNPGTGCNLQLESISVGRSAEWSYFRGWYAWDCCRPFLIHHQLHQFFRRVFFQLSNVRATKKPWLAEFLMMACAIMRHHAPSHRSTAPLELWEASAAYYHRPRPRCSSGNPGKHRDYGRYRNRQNYGKKKNVSIYRRRLSMIEKLRTFFFP